jgi:hypothetical protein
MALTEVRVPDIGDFKDVEVIEVLVKAGDTIAVEQSLVTVESDKASMEIPSTHAGVVKALKVGSGMRPAGARRRPRRLLGRLPRRRPGPEDRAGRALRHAGRRVPERGLHPQPRRCCMWRR